MKRIAWAVAAAVLTASAAQADWGKTASGMPISAALGPGYGPPPGYEPPAPPQPPLEGPHPSLISYINSPNDRPPARYGWHPSIRHFFHSLAFWKSKDECGDCHDGKGGHGACGHGHCGGGGGLYGGGGGLNYGPAAQQGTLVFPNHPFVRGPRDYYMWEPR